MTEVLENLSFLISHCHSHNMFSFFYFILLINHLFETAMLTAIRTLSVAKPEISAFDPKRTSIYNSICQLFPRTFVDSLYRCSCDLHKSRTLFLTETLFINQTNRFILIHSQNDRFSFCFYINGRKLQYLWKVADFSAFHRSWHKTPPLENLFSQYKLFSGICQ